MLCVLHVFYLKIFLRNPSGPSNFSDCLFNQFRAEKISRITDHRTDHRMYGSNLGQNIRRLFRFLAQFIIATSETELDYYHQKVNARVAERLKT